MHDNLKTASYLAHCGRNDKLYFYFYKINYYTYAENESDFKYYIYSS